MAEFAGVVLAWLLLSKPQPYFHSFADLVQMFGVWRFLAFWYSCCFPKDCCWSSSHFELSTFMSLSEIVAGYIQPWAGHSIFPMLLDMFHAFNADMRLTCNLRQNLNAADFQLLEFPLQCCLGFCARPELCSGRSCCLWPKGAILNVTRLRWWCPMFSCRQWSPVCSP